MTFGRDTEAEASLGGKGTANTQTMELVRNTNVLLRNLARLDYIWKERNPFWFVKGRRPEQV